MINSLSILLILPLLGSVALFFFPKQKEGWLRWFTVGILLIVWSLGMRQAWIFGQEPARFSGVNDADKLLGVERLEWFRLGDLTVHYFVGLDGLNMTLLMLALTVLLLGAVASGQIKEQRKGYFALYLLLSSAVVGTFIALDFFLFYLCFEFMLLPMYFLIGIWGGEKREYAAIKFFLYTLVGSVLILISGIALALATDVPGGGHTFDMIAFAQSGTTEMVHRPLFFWLLFVGFAVKLPAVPLHTWLPDAHVQAPTPISMVLAGILLKIGGYGLLRLGVAVFPDVFVANSYWIAGLGVLAILYGGTVALGQTNFKKLIAYSSVAHMGFVMLGLGSLTLTGLQGSMYQMLSHGIVSPLLFFLVGVLYHQSHELSMDRYRGLHQQMPRYTGFVAVAFFASLGLPTFSGFVGELLVLLGGFESARLPFYWPLLGMGGLILAAAYYLWNFKKMFLGNFWTHPDLSEITLRDMSATEIVVVLILTALTIGMGVYPQLLIGLQSPSLQILIQITDGQ